MTQTHTPDRFEQLEENLRTLFQLLDKTEETDDGRSFRPNQLRSCRALDAEKLDTILGKLKGLTNE
jgi:hypothetical protein